MNYRFASLRAVAIASVFGLTLSACGKNDDAAPDTETEVAAPVEAAELQPHQEMAREILRELVAIDTTQAGDTTVAAKAIEARLLAEGFPAEDIHVLGPAEDRGNLVVRYRGRDTGRPALLLLAHLDVVPADPGDWELDPFTLHELDGYFIGRGTRDDKDDAAVFIANLVRLKKEGFQPDRDIIVALTADEEAGNFNGVRWLLENHRELIEAEYALNEAGDGNLQNGQHISNNVQATEKIYLDYQLTTTHPGGHSSRPQSENAIYKLSAALLRIESHQFPVALNETTRLFFERSAELVEAELAAAMRGVVQSPMDPAAVAYLSQQPYYNALLRTTCVATQVDAGHAPNALPQRATAIVNCRMVPTETAESVVQTLTTVIGDPDIEISNLWPEMTSPPSPLTADVLGPIEELTEERWPGVPVIPIMGAGATDAIYLRNAGIPVYGVSGTFYDIDHDTRHGLNERVLVSSFFEGQEFMYDLTKRLSSSDHE